MQGNRDRELEANFCGQVSTEATKFILGVPTILHSLFPGSLRTYHLFLWAPFLYWLDQEGFQI